MTRLAISDIPDSAKQSLEALVCWGLCALQNTYPDVVALEGVDVSGNPLWVRCVTANVLQNTAISIPPEVPNAFTGNLNASPSEFRFVSRISLRVPGTFIATNPWSLVGQLGDSTIPQAFKG